MSTSATAPPPSRGPNAARRLAPDVSRILLVKSLPFKVTASDLYSVFGKYGAVRQIRLGVTDDTRGKAFVVYDDIWDAKVAQEHLNGFAIGGRYMIVLYYQPHDTRRTHK